MSYRGHYRPNGRLNPRNIVGVEADGSPLYAGGNVRRRLVVAEPEPLVRGLYVVTFFNADDSLQTDYFPADSLEGALEQAEARYGRDISYSSHEVADLPL